MFPAKSSFRDELMLYHRTLHHVTFSTHALGVITTAFVLIRKLFLKAFQQSDVDAQIHPLPASELHI